MKKRNFHYAWVILLALCLIRSLAAAGINNTGGLFLKPVSDSLGVGVGTLSIYFSISSIVTLIFMPIGGRLINRYDVKKIMVAAVLLQTVSFIALGFMKHVAAWYVLSIPMGIGGAILVNLVGPILINRWFRKDAGKALGLLMACAGLFGIGIQPLVTNLISDKGWQFTYIVTGIVFLVVMFLVVVLLISSSPSKKGLQPLGFEGEGAENRKDKVNGMSFKDAKISPVFYLLLIFMITITAFGAFNQHLATYGASMGFAEGQVGLALSITMVGSTIGAILIGIVSDKIGVYKTTLGIIASVVISIVCLYFGEISYGVFLTGAFFMGLAAMGIPVLSPLLTKEFFGEAEYELIYSNVMMGPPLATILLLPLYGFIYDKFGSYKVVFFLLGILILVGGISIIFANRKSKKKS